MSSLPCITVVTISQGTLKCFDLTFFHSFSYFLRSRSASRRRFLSFSFSEGRPPPTPPRGIGLRLGGGGGFTTGGGGGASFNSNSTGLTPPGTTSVGPVSPGKTSSGLNTSRACSAETPSLRKRLFCSPSSSVCLIHLSHGF